MSSHVRVRHLRLVRLVPRVVAVIAAIAMIAIFGMEPGIAIAAALALALDVQLVSVVFAAVSAGRGDPKEAGGTRRGGCRAD
jgi:hypothetical protein